MLKLGRGQVAAWSSFSLDGAAFRNIANRSFQIVHGLLVIFGRTQDSTLLEDIVLVDLQNHEIMQMGPTSRDANLRYEGKWQNPPIKAGSVVSSGKIWILGGSSGPKILELELKRTT